MKVDSFVIKLLLTLKVVSHEVKKKQHGDLPSTLYDHCIKLFTCSTALKFINTVTKQPLKLSLSYIMVRPGAFLLYT